MDVSSHFVLSILTVSQFAGNKAACKSVLLTLVATKRGLVSEPSSSSIPSDLCPSKNMCLVPFIIFPLNIFPYGWCTKLLFRKGAFCGAFKVSVLSEPMCPLCWSVLEQDADYRAADPDLCLPQIRANEKINFPTGTNPSREKNAFHRTVPLNLLQHCDVSGWTSSRCLCPGLCTCCWRWGGTSLAPACFANMTIYQAAIQGRGQPREPVPWVRKTAGLGFAPNTCKSLLRIIFFILCTLWRVCMRVNNVKQHANSTKGAGVTPLGVWMILDTLLCKCV